MSDRYIPCDLVAKAFTFSPLENVVRLVRPELIGASRIKSDQAWTVTDDLIVSGVRLPPRVVWKAFYPDTFRSDYARGVVGRSKSGLSDDARDVEVVRMVLEGRTYQFIGDALGGVKRQRVKQIVDKLRSTTHPHLPLPKTVRQEASKVRLNSMPVRPEGIDDQSLARITQKWRTKRAQCLAKGLLFNLTLDDLWPIPEVCPALGIPMSLDAEHHDHSVSIDRIDPLKGYTSDNVVLVSQRANRIKNDASVDELERLARYYKYLTQAQNA